ncbi:MAG TPA: hypothetical protein VM146_12530 [Steroidobacteraceae bacterium]|nr:hypothetical protein [Steroidobacteraceae bacterium]
MLAVLACALVAGCGDKPAPKPAADAGPAVPAKPKTDLAVLPHDMVAAVSAGKTAAMISVHFAVEDVPMVGKPLPVAIAVVSHSPFASVHATFDVPDSMILATGESLDVVKDVKSETVLSHKLVLQPKQEGVFLVTAIVETEGDEGMITRVYSIPLIVNPPGQAPRPVQAQTPTPAPAG